ncbi:hypothetical protein [Ekhidna sp.]
MSNFTYLIGAGASAERVPIVSEFSKGLEGFRHQIKDFEANEEQISPDVNLSLKQAQSILLQDINWLIDNCNNHASVDTFAKKLYSRGDILQYLKLKSLLNEFFTVTQKLNGLDRRYDLFFADIIQGDWNDEPNERLPNNINILSWNYDNQIEYSIADFFSIKNPQETEQILQSNLEDSFDIDRFSMVKINGSAGGYYSKDESKLIDIENNLRQRGNLNDSVKHDEIRKTIDRYSRFLTRMKISLEDFPGSGLPLAYTSSLHFSWENNKWTEEIIERVEEICANTDTLIVIGYSFPSFNKLIDRKLFEDLLNLERVIIQSPEARQIRNKIMNYRQDLKSEDFTEFTDVKEFHVPINLLD